MPRQEFLLSERVYIHNTYMKSRKSCSGTRRKFRVKFPGWPVPNPSTITRQAKIFKETGSVKDRKVNRRRHVLTEETLDEIDERNWTEITVCVWEQRQYGNPLVRRPGSQCRERQPSVATHSIWEALYYFKTFIFSTKYCHNTWTYRKLFTCLLHGSIALGEPWSPLVFSSILAWFCPPSLDTDSYWQLKLTIEALRSRSWSRYRHVFT